MAIQLCGIFIAFVYASIVAGLCFLVIERIFGLRMALTEEHVEDVRTEPGVPPDEYTEGLRACVRRHMGPFRFAWSRLQSWPEFIVEFKRNHPGKGNDRLAELVLDRELYQFLRVDDTLASDEEILRAIKGGLVGEERRSSAFVNRFLQAAFGV